MRIVVRILKQYDNQVNPGCFLTTHSKEKSYTYCFNAPGLVSKEWSYFKHAQSEQGFRVFLTKFSLMHIAGLYPLISLLNGRCGLTRLSFFGCNQFMKYFSSLKYCFGMKFLKLSAGSFEPNNDYDYVGVTSASQIKELFSKLSGNQNKMELMKKLFCRDELNVARDHIKYDSSLGISYYEDSALRIYAIDITPNNRIESIQEIQEKELQRVENQQPRLSRCYCFHVSELEETKSSINKEKFERDIPQIFRKQFISKQKIEINGKIFSLSDYECQEQSCHLLILDVENEEELAQFLNQKGYLEGNLFKQIVMIMHLSSKEMLESPKYVQFIQSTPHAKHIISASGYYSRAEEEPKMCPFAFVNYNAQMSQLFPQMLPAMNSQFFVPWGNFHTKTPQRKSFDGISSHRSAIEDAPFFHKERVWLARMLEQIHVKRSEVMCVPVLPSSQTLHPSTFREVLQNEIAQAIHKKVKNFAAIKLKELKEETLAQQYFPEIVVLGSSSTLATPLRNESGYLIRTCSDSSVLFDCGPNTFYQLVKQYGTHSSQELYERLKEIKLIFVSHYHSDHHFGVVDFLSQRVALLKEYDDKLGRNVATASDEDAIVVVVPNQIETYLSYLKKMSFDLNAVFVPHEDVSNFGLNYKQPREFTDIQKIVRQFSEVDSTDFDDDMIELAIDASENTQSNEEIKQYHFALYKKVMNKLKVKKMTIFPIFHCRGSRSIMLEMISGHKIVYSGDGRPSLRFKALMQGADFLIHECTFTSEFSVEANLKNHSFFDEVISLADEIKVKCLILSHFSTKCTSQLIAKKIQSNDYAFIYPFNMTLQSYINSRVIFAVDHLVIDPKNLRNLPIASRIMSKIQSS